MFEITKAMGIIEVKRADLGEPGAVEHCGMAILIAPRVALTCGHVVNAALHRRLDAERRPEGTDLVRLHFPMVAGAPHRMARVVAWRRLGVNPLDDLAVLELVECAPARVFATVIADIQRGLLDGGPLSVFGVRPGRAIGEHVDVKLAGNATEAWLQINATGRAGLEPGFSGAGVWDEAHQAVIGMVVRGLDSDRNIAYYVPASALIEFAGNIPHETRRLSPAFARNYTIYSAAFFLAALLHMLGDRIREFSFNFGLGNDILSAFFGLHVVLFFMPFLLFSPLSFANAYREHPWWRRVPQFGFFGNPPRASSSRPAGVATIVLLVVIPLYMSGHFLRRMHDGETKIYIDTGVHGYSTTELIAKGSECGRGRAVGYCTHPKAGFFELVPPGIPGKGGYINNAYHIGAHDRAVPRSVTFFPIVQPLLIWAATALLVWLSGMLVFRIARKERRLIDSPLRV